MDLSVIIINYNTYKLTSNCISSVIEKTKDVCYEIILVDNASTECNPQIFIDAYPQINLIASETNLGFSGGNNLGIEQASGEYILLLNSDTELINDAISVAYRIIKNDNSIGVITGQLQYPNGIIQAQAGRFPSLSREIRELFRINKLIPANKRPSYYLGTQWDYDAPVDADWVWGAFFMFKKSDLQYFPNQKLHDTFFMYGEDVQWCYHFKKALKKRIVYSPLPKLIHYIGGSDKDTEKGFERYCKKMLPNEYKWLCMVKGCFYTRLYYFFKGLHYLTLRNNDDKQKALVYMGLVVRL